MTSHFLPVYFFLYFSSFSFFLFFFRFSIFPEEAEREWKSTGYRSQQRALFLSGLILNAKRKGYTGELGMCKSGVALAQWRR